MLPIVEQKGSHHDRREEPRIQGSELQGSGHTAESRESILASYVTSAVLAIKGTGILGA